MDLRDIIVLMGLVAIVVIVWDGLRRMKLSTKQKAIAAKHKDGWVDPEKAAKKAELARELPNGGARSREMTDTEKKEIATRLNLRERVPMLMERVEVEEPEPQQTEADPSSQSELDFSTTLAEAGEKVEEAHAQGEPEESIDTELYSTSDVDSEDGRIEPSFGLEESTANIEKQTEFVNETLESDVEEIEETVEDELEELASIDQPAETFEEPVAEVVSESVYVAQEPVADVQPEPKPVAAKTPEPKIDPGPVEDLVVIHVMAKNDGELSGSAVLELLLAAGLRHGPMDIFHYRNPKGYTEFSLANCVRPGTFDPDSMNQVNTPGVTLFMQLPTAADAMESFEHMYEMASFIAQHLDAEILDEGHSSVTKQRLAYYREKLSTFARSRLIPS